MFRLNLVACSTARTRLLSGGRCHHKLHVDDVSSSAVSNGRNRLLYDNGIEIVEAGAFQDLASLIDL